MLISEDLFLMLLSPNLILCRIPEFACETFYVPEDCEKMKLSRIISDQYFVITKVTGLCFLEHQVEHIRPNCWGIIKQKSDIPFRSYNKGVCVFL